MRLVSVGWVSVIGLGVALGAHIATGVAARRAQRAYQALRGPQHAKGSDDPLWGEMRMGVGRWGCLGVALELLRGLGVLVALGAAVVWVLG